MYICSLLKRPRPLTSKAPPANTEEPAGISILSQVLQNCIQTFNKFCDLLFDHNDREYWANRHGMPSRVFRLFVLEYRSSFSAESSLLCSQLHLHVTEQLPVFLGSALGNVRDSSPSMISVSKKPLFWSVIPISAGESTF